MERFALGKYASALLSGADLAPETEQAVATKLERYTGIPAATWVRADLRITAKQFEKLLGEGSGLTTGRQDTRYTGVVLDPMSGESQYDSSTVKGAMMEAAMNTYAHETLKFGLQMTHQSGADVPDRWDFAPVATDAAPFGTFNVAPDLANVMKHNAGMHVLVMDGYFDLATTYFAAIYEMNHLPIPAPPLRKNVEYKFFKTGHEPYINPIAATKCMIAWLSSSEQIKAPSTSIIPPSLPPPNFLALSLMVGRADLPDTERQTCARPRQRCIDGALSKETCPRRACHGPCTRTSRM